MVLGPWFTEGRSGGWERCHPTHDTPHWSLGSTSAITFPCSIAPPSAPHTSTLAVCLCALSTGLSCTDHGSHPHTLPAPTMDHSPHSMPHRIMPLRSCTPAPGHQDMLTWRHVDMMSCSARAPCCHVGMGCVMGAMVRALLVRVPNRALVLSCSNSRDQGTMLTWRHVGMDTCPAALSWMRCMRPSARRTPPGRPAA